MRAFRRLPAADAPLRRQRAARPEMRIVLLVRNEVSDGDGPILHPPPSVLEGGSSKQFRSASTCGRNTQPLLSRAPPTAGQLLVLRALLRLDH